MQRIVRFVFVMMLMAATAAAQQRGSKPAAPETKPAEQPAAQKPAAPAEGLPVNVRIEITITDQRADAAPIVKTVTKTVADRTWGRIRTNGDVATKLGFRQVVLNVDTFPRVLQPHVTPDKLRVDMTIEYRPVAAEAETERNTTPVINETLTVILEDGKPMVISQSADPVTDRKVKVEAKATILK